jgi:hypothetical protein
MAKQTFTTGQTLLASQMTSLQQTAMGGGAATAKTASYVLVAADAGTTIIMNSGSATTITINDLLFAAGDTVNIQNIGAGICTITNGTATVNTAGSLALSQYEGGVLYFRSASTATFFDYVQSSTVIPLTTKGDVLGFDTALARIPIGANDTVLTADSTQSLGLKWGTAPTPSYTYSSYTPTVTQSGTLTLTSSTGAFVTIGNFIHAQFKCEIGSAGTANNGISLTLPTNASTTTINGSTSMGVGTVVVYKSSAVSVYWGFCTIKSANLMEFRSGLNKSISTDAEVWGKTGSDFAFALASGDTINISFSYRKA